MQQASRPKSKNYAPFCRRVGRGKTGKRAAGRDPRKIREIDRLTWQENLVSGQENHYFQVSSSDMNGDRTGLKRKWTPLSALPNAECCAQSESGSPISVSPHLRGPLPFSGVIGARGGFSRKPSASSPCPYETADLIEQYRSYTYPYDIFHRLAILPHRDGKAQGGWRHPLRPVILLLGQIEDMIVRKKLSLPILTLEGDKPTSYLCEEQDTGVRAASGRVGQGQWRV